MTVEDCLDLAQFDTIPTAFDHGIAASKKIEVSLFILTHEIAGAKDACMTAWVPWIRMEDCACVFRLAPITRHQARPSHIEFALLARRDRLLLIVQGEHLVAGTCFPDSDRRAFIRSDPINAKHGANVCFGWSVQVIVDCIGDQAFEAAEDILVGIPRPRREFAAGARSYTVPDAHARPTVSTPTEQNTTS